MHFQALRLYQAYSLKDHAMPITAPALHIDLLENIHPHATTLFQRHGLSDIATFKGALEGQELQATLARANVMGLRSKTHLTAELLAQSKTLEAIGCFCIGTDQVDLTMAAQMGIPVFNAPYSSTRSVAELVIGHVISLLRRVPEKNAAAHRGEWLKAVDGACEVRGKTLGIVGYGHIGTQLSVLAENIGMQVMFYDVIKKPILGNAHRAESLTQLLAQADVVTLHVPSTPETQNMIDADAIRAMKPGAALINAARGKVVDLDALADALRNKHLCGAAIDVFPIEPVSTNDTFTSPLQGLPNVILTPHIGGSTLEAQESIAEDVAEKLLRYLLHGTTAGAVNFPQVILPAATHLPRFRHVHRNEPGVLAKVNDAFSHLNLNIAAQYLQTNDQIGYVVIDTDAPHVDVTQVLAALRAIPGTIRATSVVPAAA